jgi:hypothetical protein
MRNQPSRKDCALAGLRQPAAQAQAGIAEDQKSGA